MFELTFKINIVWFYLQRSMVKSLSFNILFILCTVCIVTILHNNARDS
ncbi:hypothetical protein CNEO3_60068 [Clostridium neonatale]|uniref:Uncharacterized protein n=1 Tax=Clostridium neonatale TaxID=137838 RepID=A0AA86MKL5_9CLOT|nr:hypothetical protein CNEO_130044 [Clostridium neonatale]CAG9703154.1 hypothetical protein CNEO_40388 [Clostridium neonatale]CAG9716563.1 hypothetical protein CNEO_40012 [Clostridium neonatale]CAI3192554.1 hypothetical protein CNEO2_120060 [Clostridium neonatale]CAI3195101.1 hypothetical protein CNEO2_120060 [Clostridium neonatale]